MASAELRDNAVAARDIEQTDIIVGFERSQTDGSMAAKSDTFAELIAKIFQNPPSSLTTAQQAALRTLFGGFEAGATADQTAVEIVVLLSALAGADRLPATAIRDLPPGSGFSLRQAAGAPADSLGDDGDWYLNTTTGGFYEKASGAWELRYTDQVGAGGGITGAQARALILDWAEEGNTERIPVAKTRTVYLNRDEDLPTPGADNAHIQYVRDGNVYVQRHTVIYATPPTATYEDYPLVAAGATGVRGAGRLYPTNGVVVGQFWYLSNYESWNQYTGVGVFGWEHSTAEAALGADLWAGPYETEDEATNHLSANGQVVFVGMHSGGTLRRVTSFTAGVTPDDTREWVSSGPAGTIVSPGELSQTQVEDGTSIVYGLVSGLRLLQAIQANAGAGGGSVSATSRFRQETILSLHSLAAAVTMSEVTLLKNVAAGELWSISYTGTPGSYGLLMTDDLLAKTGQASAPLKNSEHVIPIKIHRRGDDSFGHSTIFIAKSDEANKIWMADAREESGVITIIRNHIDTVVVGSTPEPTHTSYVGTSPDTAISSAEATGGTSGTGNALAIPAYTGSRHVFFARPVSVGDFTAVYIYEDGSRNTQNQISAWTQVATVLNIGGEDHNVIYSNAALTGSGGFILEVV